MKITTTNTTPRSSDTLFTFKGTLWEDTGQKYAFPVEVNVVFNTVLYLVMLRSAKNKQNKQSIPPLINTVLPVYPI